LTDQTESSIRAAVQNCLSRCYSGDTPLGILAECLGELRAQGWSAADVRKVESAVRRVLAGVMSNDRDEGVEPES